ncbi:MAG TPA: pterin-binding protein [Nitrospiraceae bacterium]|nr:pterin-binding protein [Nitrospiraceae bacterium]
MQTTLRSDTAEVNIQTEGPIVIIGEKINPTGHKRLAEEMKADRFDYVSELASAQVAAGADILDINACIPGLDEVALLTEVVKVVSSKVSVPLCIDSSNPKAIAAALAVAPGKPLVNSVSGQETLLREMLPMVKDSGAAVIALTMDGKGIPNNPHDRLAIAARILDYAARIGIPANDVVIDPLVMAVGADQQAGKVTLKTIELLRQEFGVNIIIGASNVSFGLPARHTVNQAFLALAAGAGANCVITDPMKFTSLIRATDLLRGRDSHAKRYIRHYRAHSQSCRSKPEVGSAFLSLTTKEVM